MGEEEGGDGHIPPQGPFAFDTTAMKPEEAAMYAKALTNLLPDGGACPACKSNQLVVQPHEMGLSTRFRQESPGFGSTIYPAVLTICENCGNMQLFNSNFLRVKGQPNG